MEVCPVVADFLTDDKKMEICNTIKSILNVWNESLIKNGYKGKPPDIGNYPHNVNYGMCNRAIIIWSVVGIPCKLYTPFGEFSMISELEVVGGSSEKINFFEKVAKTFHEDSRLSFSDVPDTLQEYQLMFDDGELFTKKKKYNFEKQIIASVDNPNKLYGNGHPLQMIWCIPPKIAVTLKKQWNKFA